MKTRAFRHLAISASIAMLSAVGYAGAAPIAGASGTTDISSFTSMYGEKIVQSNSPLQPAPADTAPPTVRLSAVEAIAQSHGLTWEKVYRVSPASAFAPVTTLLQADQMVDQQGTVSLDVRGLSAYSAIRTVAASDDASVRFSPSLAMGSINANLSDKTVGQAIASLARRTHTHWSAEYVLAPPIQAPVNAAIVDQRAEGSKDGANWDVPFNGPIYIHTAPQPVSAPASVSSIANAAVAGANAQASRDAADARANANAQAENAWAAYRPYQLTPGVVVDPGNPWGGSTFVFGGSNTGSL